MSRSRSLFVVVLATASMAAACGGSESSGAWLPSAGSPQDQVGAPSGGKPPAGDGQGSAERPAEKTTKDDLGQGEKGPEGVDAAVATDAGTGSQPSEDASASSDAAPAPRVGVCATTTKYADCRACCARQAEPKAWETAYRAEICRADRCGSSCNNGRLFGTDYCDSIDVPAPAANTPCGFCLTNASWSSLARTAANLACQQDKYCNTTFRACLDYDAKCDLLDP